MSAKVFHSFRDENRDLHKQIGCMSGIFQLFDRRHFLSGRSLNGDSHKRLPPAENGNKEAEPKSKAQQKATDKSRKKGVKEKRISTESSTTTVSSSSCSSSFSSSLEFNKAAHQEPSSSGQTIYADRHTRDLSMKQPNASKPLSQQSFDSTYREARGISVRPGGKDGVGHILKYIDSPRPSQPLKPIKARVSGVNESYQVHGKLREAHRNSNEERDSCMRFAPKDARRLSYDERASRDAHKSTAKPKELPRLSFDSIVRSIRRGCSAETRSNHFFKDLQKENENSDTTFDLQPEPGSVKRPSNVVAKLMGLDLSDSVSTSGTPLRLINTCPSDRFDPLSRSSRTIEETKQGVSSRYPRNTQGFNSPQRSSNSVMKPTSNTKFPLETAPWRLPHGSKGSPRPTIKCEEETPKSPKPSPSVYGLMEKRLADLEFRKSGKDLRALKQILEAMQKSQESLDNKKDQASNVASQVNNNRAFSETIASKRDIKGSTLLPAKPMASKPQKSYKSPIILRKPGKLVDKTHTSASTVISNNTSCLQKLQTTTPVDNRKELLNRRTAKDQTPRNIHTTDVSNVRLRSTDKNSDTRKSAQKPKVPQSDENYTGPRELTGITSPRLQHRRFGLEKQSFTAPPSDSSMTRRQRGRQTLEASTPSRKLGPKSPSSRQSNSKLIETSTSTRSMSHQDDTTSQRSESNSYTDSEATSLHQSDTIEGSYFKQHSQNLQSPAMGLSNEKSMAEPGKATLEQPSPVSVLDSTFYRDDSPSPVKKISNAFKDDEENLDEAKYDPQDLVLSSCSTMSSLGTEIDQNRLENLKYLLQNHRQMSSRHEESIFGHIALLCDHTNPDHMYISEILLASGIHRFLESAWTAIEFHTLQQLINHDLFLALEEIKEDNEAFDGEMQCSKRLPHNNEEKVQRKLVFDVVNEFLVQKLVVENSFKQWSSPNKLTEGKPRGQQLLRELYSQVDQLQRTNLNGDLGDEDENLTCILLENFMDQSQSWTECDGETPGIVLDVERLIFKDLITELVSGDSADHAGWSGGHCRQLFSK